MMVSEWPLPQVRLLCRQCGWETTYERDELAALFGEDEELWRVRLELLGGCRKDRRPIECSTVLADALLVNAITEPDEDLVVEKSLLPQAREWRKLHGYGNQFRNSAA